jgi:radical SAM superfamily enzyme YgiQ (UPF0313 family)
VKEVPGRPRFVCLVQPPLVQLNTPYPAIHYLKSFLDARGEITHTADHSIGLFERIFCPSGLGRIFADAREAYRGFDPAPSPEARHIRYHIERFLSEEDCWLAAIPRLTAFLRGADREWGHLLSLANGTVPGGPRFDAALDALEGQPTPDAAPRLASLLLADLADFITAALDPSFSLIRYSPALNDSLPGFRDFALPEAAQEGYILRCFYRPFLAEEWDRLESLMAGLGDRAAGPPFILALSVPFPGCLAGALLCARSARERFGEGLITVAGGGYVNTELRFLEDGRFFDYFDYLSFDRGYGSLTAILEAAETGGGDRPLYKTMYRSRKSGRILRPPDLNDPAPEGGDSPDGGVPGGGPEGDRDLSRFREIDRRGAKTVFPDYRGTDFSRYLYPAEGENPMHRLWSDGRWLKAYLAHGCYWRACAFCDVTLDYIRCFEPVESEALFRHLLDQAAETGVRGLHLVDEAAPAASLLRFAELNREAGLPLVFWGNIRFDRAFSPDAAAVLAAGGLVGVSAGIEVATEQGFKRVRKGIGLAEVVRVCAAFKEQGILTHAYLIYGYWDEDAQEILDSAETLRQLFAAGLLDSAFWHQFILTRHSRIYAEWKRGLHPALKVLDEQGDRTEGPGGRIFARNDLPFAGSEKYDRFADPLDSLLASWMAGAAPSQTGADIAAAFPFPVPLPAVDPRRVEKLLDAYARDRDAARAAPPPEAPPQGPGPSQGQSPPQERPPGHPIPGAALFLGSRPMLKTTPRGTELSWRWRLEDRRLRIGRPGGNPAPAERIAALLETAARPKALSAAGLYRELEEAAGPVEAKRLWRQLRSSGLAVY